MSFEAAWGFDPERGLRDQRLFQEALGQMSEIEMHEQELIEIVPMGMKFAKTAAAQIYELRRMFRL